MSDNRKNIPNQAEQNTDDLDITEDEVFALLDGLKLPGIQPGDISTRMIMDRYGISQKAAYTLMTNAVKSGLFVDMLVAGENNKPVKVLRKVTE